MIVYRQRQQLTDDMQIEDAEPSISAQWSRIESSGSTSREQEAQTDIQFKGLDLEPLD